MAWNRASISLTIIISTTMSPARVVIMACSSRPERTSSWLSTATMMPMAAIRKMRSTSKFSSLPFLFRRLQQGQAQGHAPKGPQGHVQPGAPLPVLPGAMEEGPHQGGVQLQVLQLPLHAAGPQPLDESQVELPVPGFCSSRFPASPKALQGSSEKPGSPAASRQKRESSRPSHTSWDRGLAE